MGTSTWFLLIVVLLNGHATSNVIEVYGTKESCREARTKVIKEVQEQFANADRQQPAQIVGTCVARAVVEQ